MDQVKFFKGCLPQNLFGPFLNTLSQIILPIQLGSNQEVPAIPKVSEITSL